MTFRECLDASGWDGFMSFDGSEWSVEKFDYMNPDGWDGVYSYHCSEDLIIGEDGSIFFEHDPSNTPDVGDFLGDLFDGNHRQILNCL